MNLKPIDDLCPVKLQSFWVICVVQEADVSWREKLTQVAVASLGINREGGVVLL